VGESLEAKVCLESKRTLGRYHKTYKGTGLNHWVANLGLGRNPESVREYLHEMLVPHEHTYKRDNIYTTVEWRSPETDRTRRPSEKPES